jgi:hypothetical protein
MDVLAPLIKLEFMQINRRRDSHIWSPSGDLFTPSQRFVELLGHRHRLLRHVHLRNHGLGDCGGGAILWKKNNGWWESRSSVNLGFWDIVRDKLDEI